MGPKFALFWGVIATISLNFDRAKPATLVKLYRATQQHSMKRTRVIYTHYNNDDQFEMRCGKNDAPFEMKCVENNPTPLWFGYRRHQGYSF